MNPYTHAEQHAPCGQQFAVYREDLYRVLAWIQDNAIPHEIHANRVRFRPHTPELLLQYYLQYSEHCRPVDQPYPTVF